MGSPYVSLCTFEVGSLGKNGNSLASFWGGEGERIRVIWEEGKRGAKIKKEFPHLQFHLAQKPQKSGPNQEFNIFSYTYSFTTEK
jgi:hypothetical protein